MGKRVWSNRHITFIVAEKVYFTVPLALFTVYVAGRAWPKTSYGGGGWLKTSENRHMGEGYKIALNTVYDI